MRQEMANATNGSGGSCGGNPPETIHTWLERFNKKKPHSFSTVTSPDDAVHWIAHMEKIFEVVGCGDIFKARLLLTSLRDMPSTGGRRTRLPKEGITGLLPYHGMLSMISSSSNTFLCLRRKIMKGSIT